jgi:hypothetical protein
MHERDDLEGDLGQFGGLDQAVQLSMTDHTRGGSASASRSWRFIRRLTLRSISAAGAALLPSTATARA